MMRTLLWSFLVLSLVLLDQTEGWRRRRRRRCSRTNCAVSSWTSWSTCTRSCGGGTQYRTRRVTRGASCGGSCPYGLTETQNCNRHNCPVNGGWSSWSGWNSCSKTCGTGSQKRSRSCTRPPPRYGGKSCPGSSQQGQLCNRKPCPVNGGWSSWSGWNSCSKTCGTGSQKRSRSCTRPPPRYGGKSCRGSSQQGQLCNRKPCPVDGGWSSWGVWTTCSKPCGSGTQARTRSCTQPRPQNGGKTCPGKATEQRRCNTHSCPVDGGWSSWGAWTTCSKLCGSGTQARTRSCTQPRPQNGGRACPGKATEQRRCNTHSCPVHGGWSAWFVSTTCSVTCGRGVEVLSRTCTNPAPKHGGRPCSGDARKNRVCVKQHCPINGGWSRWSVWSSCSHSCGTAGFRERSRGCTNPAPRYGGKVCTGAARQRQVCNRRHCPVDGGWSSWGVWTTCTKPCESGTQARTRSCTRPRPQHGGKNCPGAAKEQRVCNTHSCPVHGGWSAWFVSTPCSVTCGRGVEVLSRTCTNPAPKHGGRRCQGNARKEQACTKKACPSWSTWGGWASCSRSCGTGSQERSRRCTQPAPKYGGKSCPGVAGEIRLCNKQLCPVDGGWSSWGVWTTCTKPCESGTQARTRSCTQPPPKNGGKTCPGAAMERRVCNTHSCPVHGGWSAWFVSTPCSVSCGRGVEVLSRTCTNPAPKHGGRRCEGNARKEQACAQKPCPVDGGWSDWTGWTSCSKSCGTGFRERSRSCTQPAPKFGGKTCPGAARESLGCNTHSCPVDGGWSGWSSWSPCGKTCGGGLRERTRSCTNPPPFFGGKGCGTHYYESKECAMNTCPVDGGWSSWSGWSSCSKSCGTGFLERSRSCTQPAPSSGGKPCPGADKESSWCNSHACPVDGGWSGWSSWSPCGKTCGGGLRERTRSCTNPPPYYGGKGCGNHYHESKECALNKCPVDGGWSEWGNWTECSVTCGIGVESRERQCDNPAPSAGGRPCQGYSRDFKSCNTTKICIDRVGCYGSFHSTFLGSFRDEIQWFVPPFSKQMQKMVDKCARLVVTKGLRYFGVENFGNCYGAKDYSSGGEPMALECNFGVGLENFFFIYKVST